MSKIKILTDSTSDLNTDISKKHNIHVIPLNVHFGDTTYRDGVDFTPESFYKMLKDNSINPKTSQPSPEDFKAIYIELLKAGDEVISIHISSKMSGTVQSANIAKKELNSNRIHIIDSGYVSVPLGLMAIECSQAAAEGMSISDICGIIEKLKREMHVYFIVDTLDYLQKGGRIGKASAIIGGLLNIKPILTIKDGYVSPFEKIRGSRKAFDRLYSIFTDFLSKNTPEDVNLGLAHASNLELLQLLKDKISNVYETSSAFITEIGPVVGTHSGPGTLAICFYSKS